MKKALRIFLMVCFGMFLLTGLSYAKIHSHHHHRTHHVNYKHGGRIKRQKGYVRKSTGKFVKPYDKTSPDNDKGNNIEKQ